jgi:NAD(P)-dependent dehydrogenase (short-subunit alcohol dehydrogenase family)
VVGKPEEKKPGKVAVVTGGAAGIGQAYARRLARDGRTVVVADVAPADETVRLIRDAGGDVLPAHCDVSDAGSVERFADLVLAGFERADILVHNAGIYPIAPFEDTDWATWRRIMDVNLDSLFHLSKAFLAGMKQAGWGRIVTTGAHVSGAPGFTAYTASKAGATGFMRSLAAEVGEHGITVNVIVPGLVRTPGTITGPQDELGLFDMARAGQAIKRTEQPEDLVGAVSFVTSEEAGFITGQTLVVDGGLVRA